MTTVIAAVMARSYTPDMFADLELWPERSYDKPTGVTTFTFAADLDSLVVESIRARMTSRDDADLAARANLAVLRDAEPFDAAALLVALANYVLGEAP